MVSKRVLSKKYVVFIESRRIMMYCKKCGKEIAENMKFCPYCGTEVSVNTETNDEASNNEENDQVKIIDEVTKQEGNSGDISENSYYGDSEESRPDSIESIQEKKSSCREDGRLKPLQLKSSRKSKTISVSTDFNSRTRVKKPIYKRKWFIALAIIIVFIFLLSQCGSGTSISDDFSLGKTYKLHNLSFKAPNGWKNTSSNSKKLVFTKTDSGDKIATVTYQYLGNDDFINKKSAKTIRQDYKDVSDVDTQKTNVKGAYLAYETNFNYGDNGQADGYIIVADNCMFSITVACPDSSNMDEDTVAEIVKGADFKSFENPEPIKKISANYYGKTKAGIKVDQKSDIDVLATYKNGFVGSIHNGWKLENPGTLKTDKTSVFHITYKGLSTDMKVVCTTMSKANYMAKCKTVTYDSLSHNSESSLYGSMVKISGQVTQVIDDGEYLVDIGSGWDFGQYVHVISEGNEGKIVEDDNVTVYGVVAGDYKYETVMGDEKTVPEVAAKYIVR